ncbi:DsrE family protein [Bradyrhizobium sp. U87765 SZCCT0131]|uniref:DsrE family protein n=1 Tax=unclassified Bradyrhizobium TaxID=2631580 RepID=UPI001BA5F836|nr:MULTISPECIES: DsrE family protein [unclassified Bradyrhizobium]MBR1217632.1 DsrE family protein [Bradyrhizobium sp. U87765 SZCCT0131]MBR1261422.1 DsrE family protein [Bradyrhizobium sp. U87765 SZCCT0134]MBR1303130.1 DsrE family protein [Bradyrhizobium sp. U87765 SZCCT0110]MBR1318736.1 DsrE family protein [Bradyrhizobium sp. U87765 SZCCT0109]MBR1347061.1 DsrE family protein [Bradyrhizobium sp. U87765 SZCCT0048]
MGRLIRAAAGLLALCGLALAASGALAAGEAKSEGKTHRVAIQVDQSDPAVMNLALNNAANIMEYYKGKGEDVQIEVVAYGPGLNMFRDDTSPVKDRLREMSEFAFPSQVKFSACNNTKEGMEKREGHPIAIVPQASLVPSGAVRLMELQEQGWTYLKP